MALFRYLIQIISMYFYKKELSKKKNVDIMKKVILHDIENIKFGEYIYIGPQCEFIAEGGIEIGDNVIFGPDVKIWTMNHNYHSTEMVPYDSKHITKKVVIGDNVWIGHGARIAPGTEIGDGCVIGMSAVVRGKIPPLSVVIGNPGQIVNKRDEAIYREIIKKEGYYYKMKKNNAL